MEEEYEEQDLAAFDDDGIHLSRWIPLTVVVSVLVGFVALAWYAYHAGTQSVKDEDLPVIEADKAPIKEKPADPGGMKFPNQDKTVYETFAGKPDTPPKVERVLPAPEEPMPKDMDTSDTTTFVNRDAHPENASSAKAEQVIGDEKPAVDKPVATDSPPETYVANPTPPAEAKKEPPKPAAVVKVDLPKAEPKPEAKPEPVKLAADKPKTVAKAAPSSGGARIQLGAYRSEKEAMASWNKIYQQQSALTGKSPLVVKADLGARGVYYRLRVGGFADAAEAKLFCETLSAKGQACMPASD